jgi:hypothetical protein
MKMPNLRSHAWCDQIRLADLKRRIFVCEPVQQMTTTIFAFPPLLTLAAGRPELRQAIIRLRVAEFLGAAEPLRVPLFRKG